MKQSTTEFKWILLQKGSSLKGFILRVGLFEDPELDFTKVLNVFYINVKKKTWSFPDFVHFASK